MARSTAQSAKRYPLTLMLGTEANVRVLRELSRHGGQLSARALEFRTGLSGSTVRTALQAQSEMGAISVAGSGYGRLYSLRLDHPLREALDALFSSEEDGFGAILTAIETAAREAGPGLIALWIYGSVARGADRPGSDIDIAVIANEEVLSGLVQKTRDGMEGASASLGFHPAVVGLGSNDVARLVRQRDSWWTGVAADAIALIGPRPEELARGLAKASQAAA
ncbi:MAG: hypothetical protein EXR07_17305 [Acetobacteraceae bacterium]|nr:hypothetical protein [Acetobacteraceae bacterium]